jgi:hypothetical protein
MLTRIGKDGALPCRRKKGLRLEEGEPWRSVVDQTGSSFDAKAW